MRRLLTHEPGRTRSRQGARTRLAQAAGFAGLLLGLMVGFHGAGEAGVSAGKTEGGDAASRSGSVQLRDDLQLLSGDRVVIGTVEAIKSDQIEVRYPESLQARYIPLSLAQDKGINLAVGDRVRMVFNEQAVLVDFHSLGQASGQHKIVKGTIAQEMKVGQERAVIKSEGEQTTTYEVRPLVRAKMASIPVGVEAVFLIDEMNHIVDATFGSREAVEQVQNQYQRMSSPKSAHTRVDGTIVEITSDGRVTLKTSEGKKTFKARPFAAKELAAAHQGDNVTLLVDSDNQVLDVAQPKTIKR